MGDQALPPPRLEETIAAFQRREDLLTRCELRYEAYRLDHQSRDRILVNDVRVAFDTNRRWQRTLHIDQVAVNATQAQWYDRLLNTILVDSEKSLFFNEFSGRMLIDDPPSEVTREWRLEHYLGKLFLCPPWRRGDMDGPAIMASADRRIFTCRQGDLWLPHALRQSGWSMETRNATDLLPSPFGVRHRAEKLLRLSRTITDRLADEIWIDPQLDHSLVCRRFRFGDLDEFILYYRDFERLAEGMVLPRACEWKRGDNHLYEKLLEFSLGSIPEERFQIDTPPGTIVEDRRNRTTTIVPGGYLYLGRTISYLQLAYPEFRRSPTRFQWATAYTFVYLGASAASALRFVSQALVFLMGLGMTLLLMRYWRQGVGRYSEGKP